MQSSIAMKIPKIMVLVLPLCVLVCVSLESLFVEAKKLACGFPGTPAYGYVKPDNAGYNEGAVVSYSCRVGYILLGSPISRCTSDGSWSEDVPICDDSMTTLGVAFSTPTVPGHPAELAIDRNRDTCTYLKPKKPRWWRIDLGEEHKVLSVAVTIISIDKDVKFTVFIIKTEGTTASYNRCGSFSGKFGTQTVLLSCAEGKGIEGEKVHIEDHYQLKGFFEICEVEVQVEKDSGYDCGRPNRNLYSITSESKNDIVEYECMRGYTLVGNDFRTCLNSGEWSGEPPICEPILCDDLEELENGDISLSHSNYGPPLEGALVIYQCHEGYKLEGGFTRSCLRDGSWSGKAPRCKVIRCPIPDGKDVGGIYRLVNLTNSMGSLAMLRCKGGKREGDNPYIKCTEEGEWTKPEAHCTLPLAAFDRKTASYINNQGGIIFGMVVAAVMIVVVLVAIYLYGEKRLSWNGPKPEIPSRSAQPSVPPPRPPPRASKGGSFKTAMMGLMNRDSTDTRNAWKNQSLPSYSDDDDESNQYGPKRVTSFEDSLPDDVAIIQVEVLPHHGLAKGRYPPVLEENEDTSLDNVALDIEEGESSPPEQMSGNENDGYEANRRTRLSKEQDSGESSSTAGASPLPRDESDAKESSAQQEGSSEEEESEEEEEESQKESKNEIERRLREEEEKRQEEERKAEEERIANEEKERIAKEEEEKLKKEKEKPSEVPRRRRLRDDPSPTVEDKPVLRRFRK